jgi:DNA (cytosine-5)-methyltransferase 1
MAGYRMTGVDIVPQRPYCGDRFIHADAIAYVLRNIEYIRETFAFIHASPPCQKYSKTQRIWDKSHPDLIGSTREVLQTVGLPYIIENVEDAKPELINPITLCGTMFGLRTYRHRLFESGNGITLEQPPHPAHVAPNAKMGRRVLDGQYYHAVGNFSSVALVRQDMAMPWATRDGISEAVPPAYTHHIARHITG